MLLGLDPTYSHANVCDPEWLHRLVELGNRVGADSYWIAEHMVVPAQVDSAYPHTADGRPPINSKSQFPDPLEWLSWLAAITRNQALCTGVLILPQHHPVHLAKRLATVDQLSGGRVRVGIGIGWLREELDLFGVPFTARARMAEEYIHALRSLWSGAPASYQGQFVRFEDLCSYPRPVRSSGIPVIVGGASRGSARRAGALGDGFIPTGVSPADVADLLATMRTTAAEAGRDPDQVEVTVRATHDLDEARALARLGVHRLRLPVPVDIPFAEAERHVEQFVANVLERIG